MNSHRWGQCRLQTAMSVQIRCCSLDLNFTQGFHTWAGARSPVRRRVRRCGHRAGGALGGGCTGNSAETGGRKRTTGVMHGKVHYGVTTRGVSPCCVWEGQLGPCSRQWKGTVHLTLSCVGLDNKSADLFLSVTMALHRETFNLVAVLRRKCS